MEAHVEVLRVLIVEDSEDDAALLEYQLRQRWSSLVVVRVDTEPDMRAALEQSEWDVILSDYSLPAFSALAALDVLHASGLDIPFLVVSGSISEETAVEVLRAGAVDFLSKGRWSRLAPAIHRELRESRVRQARRDAEQQLNDALERSAAAMRAAGVGTWELLPAAHQEVWSPELERMHGLEPGTHDGSLSAWLRLVHPDDWDAISAYTRQLLSTDVEHRVHYRVILPDNTVRWIDRRGRAVLTGAEGPRATGIALDVTAQRSLEDTLRQAQKMESIGNLAGGVAHDFNNLLTVISGYAEMLQEGLQDDPAAMADINEILHAARSATAMTRQLLAFSRRQVLAPRVVEVNEIVTGLRAMLARLIEANVQLQFDLTAASTHVRVDPSQLEQVLLNLVVNARDAMPSGGLVTIATHVGSGSVDGAEPMVHVTVADTGTGMPPEVQQRIFEPFFTTKDVGHGTGLGLATVYGIVEQSGGSITVRSQVGVGTEFRLAFPAARVGLQDAAKRRSGEQRLPPGIVILVVEDSPVLRRFVERSIGELGGVAVTADSAERARLVCEGLTRPIELALIDIMMPGQSGMAFGTWLHGTMPDVPVVFMSGYSRDKLHQEALGDWAHFLEKPFTKTTLRQRMVEALSPSSPHDGNVERAD
jgi:signal transduction histidine kinase